jgi:hypothetical protein
MPSPETRAQFDHVAVAVRKWSDAWPLFVSSLGGRWRSGGQAAGFAPAQLEYNNGLRVEVLMPHQPDQDDFLLRFLESFGPSPHHMTFKVHGIARVLEDLKERGFVIARHDIDDPWWKEIFLSPKNGLGTVVQIAEAAGTWFSPPPEGVPSPPDGITSDLAWVAISPPKPDRLRELFEEVLGAVVMEEGPDPVTGIDMVALSFRGGGLIRVLLSSPPDGPGIHHVAFRTNNFELLREAPKGTVLEPDEATGTRILVLPYE